MGIRQRLTQYRSQIVYALLSLAVMAPLLKPGFILTLDMVFTPHIRMPNEVTGSYLFYAILHCLNYVIPSDILQKVILLSITFLSGFGMYRLISAIWSARGPLATQAVIAAYVGGALYMINPYVYSRFMAGQFAVLLGYCLLPFSVSSLLILMRQPAWRTSLSFAAWTTAIGIVSIHTLGSVAILFVFALAFTLWRERRHVSRLRAVAKYGSASVVIAIIASSYWLVPLLLGRGATAQAVSSFNSGDEQAFATLGGSTIGKIANIIRLQGFWAEGRGMFTLPQTHMVGWGLVVLVFWAFIVAGILSYWRRRERFIVAVLLAGATTAICLAAGIGDGLLQKLVPFFSGFREPHKFVALVAFAYAFFAAAGVRTALERYNSETKRVRYAVILCVALLLPVMLTPTMYWGFGGQLQARQYPVAWKDMNLRLNHDSGNYQVLFLPWHLYMHYDFADRIIASPAPLFFNKPTIASNQPELGRASPTDINPEKTILNDRILPVAAQGTHLGSQLAALRIKYVLLDKDYDYRTYAYLDHQSDLRLVIENNNFKLYLNTAYGGGR